MPDELVQKVIDEWGQVDILVNNAGYTLDAPIHKMSDEWFQKMLDIHSIVPFRMCRAVAPHMREPAKKEREEGREVFRKIVNVTSISGTMGNAGQANYSSGKAAVTGLTKTLAKEWGQFKINVNAVAFGYIETRLTASKDESNVAEIAGEKVQLGIPDQLRGMASMLIPTRPPGQPAGGGQRDLPALHAVGQLHPRPGDQRHRRPVLAGCTRRAGRASAAGMHPGPGGWRERTPASSARAPRRAPSHLGEQVLDLARLTRGLDLGQRALPALAILSKRLRNWRAANSLNSSTRSPNGLTPPGYAS